MPEAPEKTTPPTATGAIRGPGRSGCVMPYALVEKMRRAFYMLNQQLNPEREPPGDCGLYWDVAEALDELVREMDRA